MTAKERYYEWLEKLKDGDPLKAELLRIKDDEKDIEERFYQGLSFGTAGLRGIVGAGTNRMNFFTVGKATQGIAEMICDYGEEAMKRGVVIAHDPRHFSKEFCAYAASVLAANGIKVYVFPDLRPTPELAWIIRRLGQREGFDTKAMLQSLNSFMMVMGSKRLRWLQTRRKGVCGSFSFPLTWGRTPP